MKGFRIVVFIVYTLCVLYAGFLFGTKQEVEVHESVSARHAVVTTINTGKDLVGFTDQKQNEWYLYGAEGWRLGDKAIIVMDDNDTEYIFDDYMITASHYEPVVEEEVELP